MLKQDSYLLLYIKEAIGFAQVRMSMRHKCRVMRPPFSFPRKKTGVARPKGQAVPIASEQLEELQCLPIALLIARRCRVSIARRFASAPIIRCCAAVGGSAALRMRHTPCGCRSAHLVGVQPNHRLSPVSRMWRAQQCHIPQAVCRRANVTRASR